MRKPRSYYYKDGRPGSITLFSPTIKRLIKTPRSRTYTPEQLDLLSTLTREDLYIFINLVLLSQPEEYCKLTKAQMINKLKNNI